MVMLRITRSDTLERPGVQHFEFFLRQRENKAIYDIFRKIIFEKETGGEKKSENRLENSFWNA
jgi:hypothetical protein